MRVTVLADLIVHLPRATRNSLANSLAGHLLGFHCLEAFMRGLACEYTPLDSFEVPSGNKSDDH